MEKTIEDSMRKIQESMKNEEKEIELESAANPGNSNFKSYRNAFKLWTLILNQWNFIIWVEILKPFLKRQKVCPVQKSMINQLLLMLRLTTMDKERFLMFKEK